MTGWAPTVPDLTHLFLGVVFFFIAAKKVVHIAVSGDADPTP